MDLWDLTKLVVRRWYISLPILLFCALATVGVTRVVTPDYTALGHVNLIPPAGSTAPDGTKNPIRNPWYELGYSALANAVLLDVTSKSVIERLADEGLADNVTVEVTTPTVLEVTVVGDSADQATATVQRMTSLIDTAVAARQTEMNVTDTDRIRTLVLDDGTNVQVGTSKRTRTLVVAMGASLMATVGLTVLLDAALRRRESRRRVPTAPPAVAAPPGLDPPTGVSAPPVVASAPGSMPVSPAVTAVLEPVDRVPPERPDAAGDDHPDDSTIVLPLSAFWRRKSGSR